MPDGNRTGRTRPAPDRPVISPILGDVRHKNW
ncbi:hypothetical protein SAM23877_5707 [Streptomyces ambofaciens ATCC 23877]|uniref:Uncharacterized protein n=1 Tax=Streptomyces ambofaciens (strain ATCC 23877 / 3486 / DSM 40053 / JCM 4204 / NBRC 12836 / NRRL B-2516) TaxID=278992 RepID=A0A0K2B0X4_STRA7|nr:hypothetical protein SAM23877_5707 [Streptomyces ambofaciens ATCC 23877]